MRPLSNSILQSKTTRFLYLIGQSILNPWDALLSNWYSLKLFETPLALHNVLHVFSILRNNLQNVNRRLINVDVFKKRETYSSIHLLCKITRISIKTLFMEPVGNHDQNGLFSILNEPQSRKTSHITDFRMQ